MFFEAALELCEAGLGPVHLGFELKAKGDAASGLLALEVYAFAVAAGAP